MFQVHPLPAETFFLISAVFRRPNAQRRTFRCIFPTAVFPCRVSLADAPEGARVFLLNYEHQPNQTPYRSRHAIFVMEGAQESHPEPGTIPASISSRLLSVRAFNKRHDIIDAEVIDGKEVAGLLPAYFARPEVNYVHLHYAGRGCYAAKVTRAP
ncbi:DUF1203 domain-containing protein [Roseibium salinum]|nr:DUF1203 domain-containing protein [Roseibium salinum]